MPQFALQGRLCDKRSSAMAQTLGTYHLPHMRGNDDYRNFRALLPEKPEHCQSVNVRQYEVEQDAGRWLSRGHLQAFQSFLRLKDRMTVRLENVPDERTHLCRIFND
jgi:hypothetical protein